MGFIKKFWKYIVGFVGFFIGLVWFMNKNTSRKVKKIKKNIKSNERKTKEVSDIYHSFKSKNGYSKLEICSKRDSLEGVLVTETEDQHITRAKEAGFKYSNKLMSNLNFLTYKFKKI